MNDYDMNALDALLREDETDNQIYARIAEECIKHAINIKHGIYQGNLATFVDAARDALRQIRGVAAPIDDIINDCMYKGTEYMQDAIKVIKAFC